MKTLLMECQKDIKKEVMTMFKGTYLRQPFYKEAVRKYEDMINSIEQMKRMKRKLSEIVAYKNMAVADIEEVLSNGHDETLETISNQMSQLKHKYSTQREYVDPQLETLQRQDWDMKMATMSDNEVYAYVMDDMNDNILSAYQLGALKKRLKEINSVDINKSALERSILQYELANSIGEEYKNTDEYNKLLQLQSECVSYGKQYLWTYDLLSDESKLIDFRDTSQLLDGYDVDYSF